MPGKMVSPERIRAIRLSLSSSLVLRARSLCSEKVLFLSSPKVIGRFMKGPLALIIRLDLECSRFDDGCRTHDSTGFQPLPISAHGRWCWPSRGHAYVFPVWGWQRGD